MIEAFNWLDAFLVDNGNILAATLAIVAMLAIIGAIAELEG